MITNYTELKQEVADFAHRDDLTSKMDTFCQLAESVINNGYEHPSGKKIPGLRSLEMEKRSAQTFDATFFDLPSDYLEMKAVEVEFSGRRNPLRQVSPQILDSTYSTASGNPRAYSIHAGQIEFRPGIEATAPYTGELIYYAAVPTLTSASSNDVLTAYPHIYLAGMLLFLNIYLQDDEQAGIWISALNSGIRGANGKGRYVLPKVSIC
jgi:hypothetical protein